MWEKSGPLDIEKPRALGQRTDGGQWLTPNGDHPASGLPLANPITWWSTSDAYAYK